MAKRARAGELRTKGAAGLDAVLQRHRRGDLGGAVAAQHHPEAILIRQELHVHGPILLCGALAQEHVLLEVRQNHVAFGSHGLAVVVEQHRAAQDGLILRQLIPLFFSAAVGYLAQAGVSLPEEGTPRRAQYDLCINYLVLDSWENRMCLLFS